MGTKLLETTHEAYGRVLVDGAELETSETFIKARLLNEPSNIQDMSALTLGKAALKDQGGYVRPEGRSDSSRVEQYLPLVYKAVQTLARPNDDWDELFAEGCLALVAVERRFDSKRNNGFAAFAKPRIMGAIKNLQDPTRNGTMNIVSMHQEYFENTRGEDKSVSEVMDAMLTTLDTLTKKQRQVMKGLYIEGHTMQNMADIMGVTPPAINNLKNKAIVQIKKKLRGAGL